jgi:uncharacterized membrane protein YdbT with pleckstrin-like domain
MADEDRVEGQIIWRQRKRNWCRTSLSFTVYTLTTDELTVESGILRQVFDTTQLFRINDVRVTRTLLQRIFGLSTIVVYAYDASSIVSSKRGEPLQITLKNVIDGFKIRKQIQAAVNAARSSNGVIARDIMGDVDEDGVY